jgi:hypothetical protein
MVVPLQRFQLSFLTPIHVPSLWQDSTYQPRRTESSILLPSEVLILGDFKSLFPEVLILEGLKCP